MTFTCFIFQTHSDLRGKNILLCVVYIPPENVKYSSIEMFDVIENCVVQFYEEEVALCIIDLGDINARSRDLSDVLYFDKNMIDLEEHFIFKKQVGNEALLDALVRVSCDKQIHNYGYRLAELYRHLAVLVANGRCEKDRCMGKTTCNNKSLV